MNFSTSFYLGVFVVFTFLLYGNTLNHDFVLDDSIVITENSFVKQGLSGIPSIFSTESMVGFYGQQKSLVSGGRYRPLSIAVFALIHQVFGMNAKVFHLFTVLFYLTNVLLLFKVLLLLFKERIPKQSQNLLAAIITLLFIAHPIHTEVVANIKGSDEILSFTGVLASLYFLLKYIDYRNWVHLIIAMGCYFFALLSKETAITFLAIIPVTIYFFRTTNWKLLSISFGSLFTIAAIWYLIRGQIIGSMFIDAVADNLMNDPFLEASTSDKYATIIFTLWKYIALLFFPHPLTYDYYPKHIPIVSFTNLIVIWSVIVYVSLILFSIKGLIKKNIYAFGIILYGLSLSISSNLFFSIGVFMNERFLYVSSLGFCIILAHFLLIDSHKIFKNKNIAIGILFGILLAYSGKTISRNQVWKSNLVLATTDAKTSVNGAKSQTMAGGLLLEQAQSTHNPVEKQQLLMQSIAHLQKAIDIYPEYIDPKLLMGNAQYELSKSPHKALKYYYDILTINPSHSNAHQNIQFVIGKVEDPSTKVKLYEEYVIRSIEPAAIYFLIGNIYGQQLSNLPKSIKYLDQAYNLKPNDADIIINLTTALSLNKQFTESIDILKNAIQYSPNNAQYYLNLGLNYFEIGEIDKAKTSFDTAVQLNPNLNRSQFPV